jgi:hypothetical protein
LGFVTITQPAPTTVAAKPLGRLELIAEIRSIRLAVEPDFQGPRGLWTYADRLELASARSADRCAGRLHEAEVAAEQGQWSECFDYLDRAADHDSSHYGEIVDLRDRLDTAIDAGGPRDDGDDCATCGEPTVDGVCQACTATRAA